MLISIPSSLSSQASDKILELRVLRIVFARVRLLVIDEISMVSREILHWVDRRLQEICTDDPFGNISSDG